MVEIKEVVLNSELKNFVRFPYDLYRGCPYYVPSMEKSELRSLQHHPALSFCTMKLWLAYKNGATVGRVAGIINHKCNDIKEQKRVRFGWLDFIEDYEVVKALLDTVQQWGWSLGMNAICGPSRFSNMEKQSMLVDGFDVTPSIGADYNYPYYPKLVEQYGLEKEVDYVQYKVPIKPVPERMSKLADIVAEKYHVRLREFKNKSELKRSGKELFHALNQSYAKIFNFIPLTDAEIDWTIDENFQVANVDMSSVLEDEAGNVVGFAFCLPSLSEAFQKAKGHLFPMGWIYVLRALKKRKYVDLYLTGVLPKYMKSGIHAIYHKQLNENLFRKGFQYAFTSQQIETNTASFIWQKYGGELIARRRCYVMDIYR